MLNVKGARFRPALCAWAVSATAVSFFQPAVAFGQQPPDPVYGFGVNASIFYEQTGAELPPEYCAM